MHVYSTHTCSIIVLLEIFTEILVYAVHIHDDVHTCWIYSTYCLSYMYMLRILTGSIYTIHGNWHVHVVYMYMYMCLLSSSVHGLLHMASKCCVCEHVCISMWIVHTSQGFVQYSHTMHFYTNTSLYVQHTYIHIPHNVVNIIICTNKACRINLGVCMLLGDEWMNRVLHTLWNSRLPTQWLGYCAHESISIKCTRACLNGNLYHSTGPVCLLYRYYVIMYKKTPSKHT